MPSTDSRQEMGCKGIAFLGLAVAYFAAYKIWGMDGYVYFGCGFLALMGLFQLFLAPFVD